MLAVGVVRWFMKGWMDSIGAPEMAGSLLSSITIVLLVGLVIFYAREGRSAGGRYLTAAGWWVALTAWSQAIIIAGILLAARTGASTYYSEMVAQHRDLPPVQHALSHGVAFFAVAAVGLLLGWPMYWLGKRKRPAAA